VVFDITFQIFVALGYDPRNALPPFEFAALTAVDESTIPDGIA
jgi:hypothetical protein